MTSRRFPRIARDLVGHAPCFRYRNLTPLAFRFLRKIGQIITTSGIARRLFPGRGKVQFRHRSADFLRPFPITVVLYRTKFCFGK